jgi:molybdopterin converting factor small subunit
MKVRVKLFAAAKQLAGAEMVAVDVPEPVTVSALREAMVEQIPSLKGLLAYAAFALNAEYALGNALIPADAEVACIPPVSGG